MSSRELQLRIQDMLTEIEVVEETIQGLTYEKFSQNRQALRVVLYSLAVLGEAVASVIDDLEALAPEMPWHQIRGMRNAVMHEYFRIDVETVWETTQSDLPALKAVLKSALSSF